MPTGAAISTKGTGSVMELLINIDNGGTFTDVCVFDGANVHHGKSPTTPHDLTQCFVKSLEHISKKIYGDADLYRLIRDTKYLRYSTTSGTNAVVERKGTPVGLIVDAGQEGDIYGAIASTGHDDLWTHMVPQDVVGIAPGIASEALVQVVNRMLEQGMKRLVIGLSSAAEEQRVKEILLDRYPRHLLGAVPFMLSHEVSQDSDSGRRVVTAVLNSYLHPGMEHFLYGAEGVCKTHFMGSPLLIYRNDGDSARVAKTTAIRTWGSGPRGGLQGAVAYAELYKLPVVVGMDIGGTTTDVSVVRNGKIGLQMYGRVEGAQTSVALPDILSFGFGGSSIFSIRNGRIAIGPESVGAAPGPACFGRGGTEATLTDALLLAGIVDGENYLGGELKLDKDRARNAIHHRIAEPLGLGVDDAVAAMIDAFEQQVGSQIAQTLADGGISAGDATLLVFGGGGPILATGIAEAAGMRSVIVPDLAAVFSAFGIGFSGLAHHYLQPLEHAAGDLDAAKAVMTTRAKRDMLGEGVSSDDCRYEFAVWEERSGEVIEHPLTNGKLPASSGKLSLRASFDLPTFALTPDKPIGASPLSGGATTRIGRNGSSVDAAVHAASAIVPGNTGAGPALIRSEYLTCFVKPGWKLRMSANRDLILEETK